VISLRALITGASGFVGTFMMQAAMSKSMDVLGISRTISFINGQKTNEYKCDILEKTKLKKILRNYQPDYVIHLAGPAFIPDCFNQPQLTYDTIFNGTLNLLECIRELNLRTKVLYVSSADIYGGATKSVLSENDAYEPTNPYSSAKACAELLCRQYYLSYGMEIIIARPFNHTGPGQSADFVCSSFAYQISLMKQSNDNLLFTGNIDVQRDFLDVRDVVDAYLCLLEKGIVGEVYNVCSGKATLIRDIVDILFRQAGSTDYRIIVDHEKARKNDIQVRVGDNAKLTSMSDWKPKYSIERTLADLYQYWKENLHVKA
jgi:GDP-4-dehydro-6-deoxy-D-mannose reductase